jgi:hypothetical protein
MIDRATFDRLVALGRAKGGLTAAELQAALPVEAMEVDALVMLMLELEEAGVGVEPDALGPRSEGGTAGPVLPLPDPGVPRPAVSAGGSRPSGEGAPSTAPSGPAAPPAAADDEGVTRVVLLAGLVALAILGTILVLV